MIGGYGRFRVKLNSMEKYDCDEGKVNYNRKVTRQQLSFKNSLSIIYQYSHINLELHTFIEMYASEPWNSYLYFTMIAIYILQIVLNDTDGTLVQNDITRLCWAA